MTDQERLAEIEQYCHGLEETERRLENWDWCTADRLSVIAPIAEVRGLIARVRELEQMYKTTAELMDAAVADCTDAHKKIAALESDKARATERIDWLEQHIREDRSYPYNIPQRLWTDEEARLVSARQQLALQNNHSKKI